MQCNCQRCLRILLALILGYCFGVWAATSLSSPLVTELSSSVVVNLQTTIPTEAVVETEATKPAEESEPPELLLSTKPYVFKQNYSGRCFDEGSKANCGIVVAWLAVAGEGLPPSMAVAKLSKLLHALLSISLVRMFPIVVITNHPTVSLNATFVSRVTLVVDTGVRTLFGVMQQSPFEYTLFLNSSVRPPLIPFINYPPTVAFGLLEFFDLAAVALPFADLRFREALDQRVSPLLLFHYGLTLYRSACTLTLWRGMDLTGWTSTNNTAVVENSFLLAKRLADPRLPILKVATLDPILCVDARFGYDQCHYRRNRIPKTRKNKKKHEAWRCDHFD